MLIITVCVMTAFTEIHYAYYSKILLYKYKQNAIKHFI